jgi:hypothetical protein
MRTTRPRPYGPRMTQQQLTPTLDPAVAERLAAALNDLFATGEAPEDAFAPDVFGDLLPPFWRFQLEGAEVLAGQLRAITAPGSTVRPIRVVPTATGFVVEHEHTQPAGDDVEVARRLVLCEVRDDRITEVVVYCNGGWDADLRARHAAEAPMLRSEP